MTSDKMQHATLYQNYKSNGSQFDGLVQDCSNCNALAMELLHCFLHQVIDLNVVKNDNTYD